MRRGWLILALLVLIVSLLGNAVLLWVYAGCSRDLRLLEGQADRQQQELGLLQEERDELAAQVRALEEERTRLEGERTRLEEERAHLEGELAAYRGQQDTLELLDRLEAEVRAVRRLVPPEVVERAFVPKDELHAHLGQQFAATYSTQQATADARVLEMLGLLRVGTDLHTILLDLYTDPLMAVYDLAEGRLYLPEDGGLGPVERLAYVHEYVRALQDQVFDLGKQVEALADDGDRSLALESLAEGDALLAMQQYLLAHPDEFLSSDLLSQSLGIETPGFGSAPAVVRERMLFPYQAGLSFTTSLHTQRGWAGVDAAWADPPQSSEQILHPDRYPDDGPVVVALPALTTTLGAGWRFQGEDTLGEYMLRLHLALLLDADQVDRAATGWGGDRYALYLQPEDGAACLVMRLVWDDDDEAEEFVEFYLAYGEARYGRPGEGDVEEGIWWGAREGLYLRRRDTEVRLILAPDRELAERVERRLR